MPFGDTSDLDQQATNPQKSNVFNVVACALCSKLFAVVERENRSAIRNGSQSDVGLYPDPQPRILLEL